MRCPAVFLKKAAYLTPLWASLRLGPSHLSSLGSGSS